MKIPSGSPVGLCDHVPVYPDTSRGIVLEVQTDAGQIVVLVCARCWTRYARGGDLSALVTRQIVTGKNGWDVKVDMEAPS